jgi:hypothetical protein
MPKRGSDHVIWDNSVEGTQGMRYEAMRLRCLHCGDVYDLAVPVSLRVVGAVMKAYGQDHRGCRKPKPTLGDGPWLVAHPTPTGAAAASAFENEETLRARGDVTAEPPPHADAPRANPEEG